MDDIVELVKAKNLIEDVVEADDYPLKRVGRYARCNRREDNDLVIDTHHQSYHWNKRSEHGDVINWVMNRRKTDFKGAVEFLCERARLPLPKWGGGDQQARMAARAKEDAWEVALRVMNKWLWADAAATGYVRGRGWCDETIKAAQLGFSGNATPEEAKDMRGELQMHGVDVEAAAAVAILGYRGDVAGWARAQGLSDHPEWVRQWEEWGFVPGLIGKKRLVYPHLVGGRVRYFSGRNILGDEINKEGREVKSYNPPVVLVGPRQPFFNHVYAPKADECVVIEGQGDAVTLGQWELPAMAIAGTAFTDHAQTIEMLRERHQRLYIGLDGDEAGNNALVGRKREWPLVDLFGAGARVIRWPREKWTTPDGKEKTTKDANDVLQLMVANGGGNYVANAA